MGFFSRKKGEISESNDTNNSTPTRDRLRQTLKNRRNSPDGSVLAMRKAVITSSRDNIFG